MNKEIKEMDFTKLTIAMFGEKTIKDAAEAIGVSESTAYRWLNDPECLRVVAKFNRESNSAAALIAVVAKCQAMKNIEDLSKNAVSESVRLKANLTLIEYDFKFTFELEVDARLRELRGEIERMKAKYGEELG